MGAEIEVEAGSGAEVGSGGAEVRAESVGGGAEGGGSEVDETAPSVEAAGSGAEGDETAPSGGEAGGSEGTEPETDDKAAVEAGEAGDEGGSADENPWNGELSTLDDQGWYQGLDETGRKNARSGLERIRKSMERTFHSKMEEVSDLRERVMERDRLITELMHDDKDFSGTIDDLVDAVLEERLNERTAELTREIEELRGKAESSVNKAEIQQLQDKLKALEDEKLDLQANYERDRKRLETYEDIATKAYEAELDAMADEATEYLKTNAPDILENDEALELFFLLPSSCESPEGNEKALQMLRIQFPAPEKEDAGTEPEDVPDSVDLMDTGSGGSDPADGSPGKGGWSHIDEEIRREKLRQGKTL